MDKNSSTEKEQDYTTVKDGRGEIKVYTSPTKNIEKQNTSGKENNYSSDKRKSNKRRISKGPIFFILKVIGCWLPIAIIVLFIVALIVKPPTIWDGLVDLINSGISVPVNTKMSDSVALQEINTQLTTVGENIVTISESQLAGILVPRLKELQNLNVDIEDNSIKLVWALDKNKSGKELYGIIVLEQNGNDLVIKKIGTGLFYLPESLNNFITQSILSITQIGDTSNPDSLMRIVLPFDESLEIKSLDVEKDQIRLNVLLDASLFRIKND